MRLPDLAELRKGYLSDTLVLLGLGAVTGGIMMIYVPAALIFDGIVLVGIGMLVRR